MRVVSDALAFSVGERARKYDEQGLGAACCHRREGAFKVSSTPHLNQQRFKLREFLPRPRRSAACRRPCVRSTNQETKARRRLTPWERSIQQRQSFGYQLRGENGESSDVAAGVREAGHKTFTHGIAKVEGDDWNGCGRPISGIGCGVTERSNEVDPETNTYPSSRKPSLKALSNCRDTGEFKGSQH